MDPLSVTASIFTILELSEAVLSICYKFRKSVKGASGEAAKITKDLKALQDILEQLLELAEIEEKTGTCRLSSLSSLTKSNGPLARCLHELESLEQKLKPATGLKQVGKALSWPFKEGEVRKALEGLESIKASLQLALITDNTQAVFRVEKSVEELRLDSERKELVEWLQPVDPSTNHNNARPKHEPTTGNWLLKSEELAAWLCEPKQLLWLHGIPGCGKSILCSTVVEHVKSWCKTQPKCNLFYFYFDFSDSKKQATIGLVRSVLSQLISQTGAIPDEIKKLYKETGRGNQQSGLESLIATLLSVLKSRHETYLILDALDECSERESLLGLLSDLRGPRSGNVHILTTSRREYDIELVLGNIADESICIQSAVVDADIKKYVQSCLVADPKLSKWPVIVKDEIEDALVKGSHGMFRWVVCQIDVLRRCRKLPLLRQRLRELPNTIDETYDRILLNIPEDDQQAAHATLQWLAFSQRPMTLGEISEAIAVDTRQQCFDVENRFLDAHSILEICSSMVTISESGKKYKYGHTQSVVADEMRELQLAHYSVKEYIVSERIRSGRAKAFAVVEAQAHEYMAEASLVYLLSFDKPDSLYKGVWNLFPFLDYAARYWSKHSQTVTGEAGQQVLDLTRSLLDAENNKCFVNWLRIWAPDDPYDNPKLSRSSESVGPPLDYAAFMGLLAVGQLLIDDGADVNAEGGSYGGALQAACHEGHEAIVQLLIAKGANVNAQGGLYGTALQTASKWGHEAIVQLLIAKGANVNAQGELYGTALQTASKWGHEAIVQLLIEKGANVNAQGELYGTALQTASKWGHEAIVQLLIEKGANVNAQGGLCNSTALQTAIEQGHEAIVQLLIEKGANVNAQSRHNNSTALQTASEGGHVAIVQLLIAKGANVNAQGGLYGTALQTASTWGNKAIVQLLIEKEANVNAQGGVYGTALEAAIAAGNKAIVQLLIEKEANVNAQGGVYGTALEAAIAAGNKAIVQLLIEKGANVDAQSGYYHTALRAVVIKNNDAIARLLLSAGADVSVLEEPELKRLKEMLAGEGGLLTRTERAVEVEDLGMIGEVAEHGNAKKRRLNNEDG
ncbi:MAG: hypothetical protein M1830_001788 [Pleopsidium flavum]|nr:MAG: hypothetical protein M1830_001788 [Pleopsidium flavum]